jgi:hypothetical protein
MTLGIAILPTASPERHHIASPLLLTILGGNNEGATGSETGRMDSRDLFVYIYKGVFAFSRSVNNPITSIPHHPNYLIRPRYGQPIMDRLTHVHQGWKE